MDGGCIYPQMYLHMLPNLLQVLCWIDGWSWCQFSSDKLKELLGPTLPLLVHHPAVAVREVLGTGEITAVDA